MTRNIIPRGVPIGIEAAPRTSEAIMLELFRGADDKRKATLKRLKEACDAIAPHKEITGMAVEAYCKQFHNAGPKAQSIANDKRKTGQPDYLGMWHYLEARKREQDFGRRRRRMPLTLDAIDQIDKPEQRALARELYDQSQVNARAVLRAKSLFARIAPGVNFDDWIAAYREGTGPIVLPASGAPPVKLEHLKALEDAVRSLTDPVTLDRCGLHYDGKRVKRKGGTGEALLGPNVVMYLIDLHRVLTGVASAAAPEVETADA
jgi:hypothetical protein